MQRLRVAIVGQGAIGKKHAQSVSAVSSKIDVGVVSRRRLESIDPRFFCLGSNDQLMNWQPDVVMLANEASKRREDFETIAGVAATILLEKPVASSLEDAIAIKAIADARKARTFVAYNLRMSSALLSVRKYVGDGSLGKLCHVTAVVGQNLEWWRPGRDVAGTVSASRAQGGGVMRELSHEIDLLASLFGPLSFEYSLCDRKKFTSFDVEDVAHIGFRSSIESGRAPISLVMDFVRHDLQRAINIIGTDGTLSWDLVNGTVSLCGPDGAVSKIYDDQTDLTSTQQNLWKHILLGEETKLCTVEESIEVMGLIHQAEERGAS